MTYDDAMSKPHQKNHGFTLIEIIVVVAIIGIIVAFVGVKISRDTDRLASLEAKRMHAIISELRDEAIISGQNLALSLDDRQGRYMALRWQSGWQEVNDGLFKTRHLEAGVELQSYILDGPEQQSQIGPENDPENGLEGGSENDLENDLENEEEPKISPYIFISPDGMISNFKIILSGSTKAFEILFDHTGKLLIESHDK